MYKYAVLGLLFVSCIRAQKIDLPDFYQWEEMEGVMSRHYNYYRTNDGDLVELLDRHFWYEDYEDEVIISSHEVRVHYNQKEQDWFAFYTVDRNIQIDPDIYVFEKKDQNWVFVRKLQMIEVVDFYKQYFGILPLDWELEQLE